MGVYQTSIYISNLVNCEEHTSQIPNTCSVLRLRWRLRSGIISLISRDMLLFFDTNWSPSVIGSDKRLTFRARFYLVLQIPERISSQTPACLLVSSQIQFSSFPFLPCSRTVLVLLWCGVIKLLFSTGIISIITWVWFPCLLFICDVGVVQWMLVVVW